MLLSIIIPVYNAENFIERCINSILKQCNGLENIELVIVNDGSTDNSEHILNNMAKTNSIIKLYTQENKGEGYTRNIGLERAKGEYICFVDADDFLDGDIIERIYKSIKVHNESDVIMYGMKRVTENGKVMSKVEFNNETITVSELLSRKIYSNSVCNKVFRIKNIRDNNVQFNTIVKTATDFDFSFRMLFFSEKITTLNGLNYNYIVNPDSVSNIRTSNHLERLANHSAVVANNLKSFLDNNKHNDNHNVFNSWLQNYLYGLLFSLFRFDYRSGIIQTTLNTLIEKNNYPVDFSRMSSKKKLFVFLANKKNVFLSICKLNRIKSKIIG